MSNYGGHWTPPFRVRISRLALRCKDAPVGDSQVFVAALNSVPQLLTVTLMGVASADDFDETHSFYAGPTDYVSLVCVAGAAIATGATEAKAFLRWTRA